MLQEELGFSCSRGKRCRGLGSDLAMVLLVDSSALTRSLCGDLQGAALTRAELEGTWPESGKWPNFHVHWCCSNGPEIEISRSSICHFSPLSYAGAEVPVLSL